VDTVSSKRTSLHTSNEDEAQQIVDAKNQAERQPVLNLQIARAYLAGSDTGINTRTWADAILALTNSKKGSNKERWQRAAIDKAFVPLLPKVIIETRGETLLSLDSAHLWRSCFRHNHKPVDGTTAAVLHWIGGYPSRIAVFLSLAKTRRTPNTATRLSVRVLES